MELKYYINQKGEIPDTALSLTGGGARAMRPRPWARWTIWPESWA